MERVRRLGDRAKRNPERLGNLAVAEALGAQDDTPPVALRQRVQHRRETPPALGLRPVAIQGPARDRHAVPRRVSSHDRFACRFWRLRALLQGQVVRDPKQPALSNDCASGRDADDGTATETLPARHPPPPRCASQTTRHSAAATARSDRRGASPPAPRSPARSAVVDRVQERQVDDGVGIRQAWTRNARSDVRGVRILHGRSDGCSPNSPRPTPQNNRVNKTAAPGICAVRRDSSTGVTVSSLRIDLPGSVRRALVPVRKASTRYRRVVSAVARPVRAEAVWAGGALESEPQTELQGSRITNGRDRIEVGRRIRRVGAGPEVGLSRQVVDAVGQVECLELPFEPAHFCRSGTSG